MNINENNANEKISIQQNFPRRINWLFPFLLVLYEISIYLSNDMYLPALPKMMQDLKLTTTQVQLTITMWFLGSASTPLIMGALADRFGRRKTLLLGGILYIFSTLMCALAINEYTLLIPRIIEGAMVSSMMVAGYAVIHESYEHKEAIRILAIMGSISVLAPALGPLFGAIVLLFGSWRWIFWFITFFSSVMIFCLYLYMPETLSPDKRQPLHVGIIINNYWKIMSNPFFILLMSVLGLIFVGFISWVTAGPLLVIEHMKYSEIMFGWMQAAVFTAYILGSRFVNFLLKKYNAPMLVNLGLSIAFLAGLFIFIFSSVFPTHFYLFLLSIIIFSFGSALCFSPLNRLIIETSNQPMGIRVALFTAGLMICGVLGSSIVSIVYNGTSFSLGIIITVCVMMACILQFIYIQAQKKSNSNK